MPDEQQTTTTVTEQVTTPFPAVSAESVTEAATAAAAQAAYDAAARAKALTPDELAIVKNALVKANPDAVPEMIEGNTVEALNKSVEGARLAYTRLADQLGRRTVPAGGAAAPTINVDNLSSTAKIAYAIKNRKQ